jgi:cytochrome P450
VARFSGPWTQVAVAVEPPERSLPAGPRSPSLVQTYLFSRRALAFLSGAQRRYGDVFALRLVGMGDVVVIADPVLVREVVTGSPELFLAGEANPRMRVLMGSSSLLVIDGEEHLTTRKRLSAVLHGESVCGASEVLIAELAAERLRAWPVGKPISMYRESRAITSEMTLRAVLGVHDSPLLGEMRRVLAQTMEVRFPIGLWYTHDKLGLIPPWRGYAAAVERAHKLIERLIAIRENEDLTARTDMLSMLIGSGKTDRKWLQDQMMTLVIAGEDTTTTGLSWAVELLARHPGARARAREQGDSYIDAAVIEALRLRTVLPGAARRLAGPVTVGPYEFPAGTTLIVPALLMSRDPRLYEDPDEFRPERWLGERPGAYTWLAFGGGRRRCIGATFAQMELRVVLRTMLQRIDWRAVGRRSERANLRLSMIPARGALIARTR